MARRPQESVDAELAALDELPAERAAKLAALEKALTSHYRVAAKAARAAEDSLLYELVPALKSAYARFLDKPLKQDPNCFAKKALARALVALDCDDVDFFLAGVRYRQLEPAYGGANDTAPELRASCAMGLVASGYSRALVELTALLHDEDAGARAGAVRAVACGSPREAELVLRAKALAGDEEPQVVGECFTGLLAVEPEQSIAFVAAFLGDADDAVRELAALSLGESRLDAALAPLREAWADPLLGDDFRRALLRAAAAHRSDAALDWLVALVAEARVAVAVEAIDALAPYKHNAKLMRRLASVLAERADASLLERLAAVER
jgi:hypothetical protein